jgi:hypothetical protein
MNRSLYAWLSIAALLLPIASVAGYGGRGQDVADIQHVMDSFHVAVVAHDGSKLGALFIPAGSTWLNILSDEAYARAKLKSPDARKIRLGSYQAFASFVSSSKDALEPRHSHVKIQTDGVIAAVYFDFVFLINGKEENRGTETWQLVKGPEGWRIAAITYSSDPHEP